MIIVNNISECLTLALILSPIIKVCVDLVKMLVKVESLTFYYYVSGVVGGLLGALLPSVIVIDLYIAISIGIVAGLLPAPILHDVIRILKNIKDVLDEIVLEYGFTPEENQEEDQEEVK